MGLFLVAERERRRHSHLEDGKRYEIAGANRRRRRYALMNSLVDLRSVSYSGATYSLRSIQIFLAKPLSLNHTISHSCDSSSATITKVEVSPHFVILGLEDNSA